MNLTLRCLIKSEASLRTFGVSLTSRDVWLLGGLGARVCVCVCRERSWMVPKEFAYDLDMTFTFALGRDHLQSIRRAYISFYV